MWILHCNPQGELVVQSESFSKEHILRTNRIGFMAAISNWSHDPYRTFSNPRDNDLIRMRRSYGRAHGSSGADAGVFGEENLAKPE
jgi:hypothetical protein